MVSQINYAPSHPAICRRNRCQNIFTKNTSTNGSTTTDNTVWIENSQKNKHAGNENLLLAVQLPTKTKDDISITELCCKPSTNQQHPRWVQPIITQHIRSGTSNTCYDYDDSSSVLSTGSSLILNLFKSPVPIHAILPMMKSTIVKF